MRGISWQEYEELLTEVGEARGLRVSFDRGRLHIITLSAEHENIVAFIQDLVRLVSLRLRVKVLCFGSATMKRQRTGQGVEPDVSFYVQHAEAIGSRRQLDFNTDPPPDLVVEVDLYHESFSKFPIYVELRVPELWRYSGQELTIYHLQQDQYVEAQASLALPTLTSQTLTNFLLRSQNENQYAALLAFEDWLQAQPS
ncbi:MAG: Uma2 family endonuclease [Acidobacteria bacterium]|nr:Uma2 family endonuclease [Acidobacteriota bacterium]